MNLEYTPKNIDVYLECIPNAALRRYLYERRLSDCLTGIVGARSEWEQQMRYRVF